MEADRALRGIGGERHWKAARDGYDLLTDLAPIVGVRRAGLCRPRSNRNSRKEIQHASAPPRTAGAPMRPDRRRPDRRPGRSSVAEAAMTRQRLSKTNFTSGEISAELLGRGDLTAYDNGAALLRNVFILPTGGVTRRPGLRFVGRLQNAIARVADGIAASAPKGGDAADAADAHNGDPATFLATTARIGTADPYVAVRFDLGQPRAILFADAVDIALSDGAASDEFRIQYSADDTAWSDFGPAFGVSGRAESVRRTGPGNTAVTARIRDRLRNKRPPAVPDNHPDLDRFKGDFSHSPTTLDFRAKFEADAGWQKHRARTRGRVERGIENKGQPIRGLKEGDVARIGDVRLFERNGESYARGLDDIERKIGRKPKEGKGLPVDNKPHLEKDVIYGESRDGGRVIEIAVRDKNTGKELFRNSVYYSRYGVPEFEAKGSFWLPPEKMASKPDGQRIWIQDRLREMAQDRKRHRELRRMGFTARQIEILRVKGYKKDLGVEIHHDYQLGRMILVDSETHTRFAHVGGGKLWGTKQQLLAGEAK